MSMPSFPFLRQVVISCALVIALPAWAGTVYENGPINGTLSSADISYGMQFTASDSFTVSGGGAIVSGLTFGAWLRSGDTLTLVDVAIMSLSNGGTTYYSNPLTFTQSNCFTNQVGQSVCQESVAFAGPTLADGTYWLSLSDALTKEAGGVGWDQNNGVGCMSPGCPSQAFDQAQNSISSSSFAILGGLSRPTPEPGSVTLFATGVAGLIAALRRKLR